MTIPKDVIVDILTPILVEDAMKAHAAAEKIFELLGGSARLESELNIRQFSGRFGTGYSKGGIYFEGIVPFWGRSEITIDEKKDGTYDMTFKFNVNRLPDEVRKTFDSIIFAASSSE